jgi:hypothetical protein
VKIVRSVKNQYLGVNAHLHSDWQARGGWGEFHTSYIVDLSRALKAQLLPMGYTASIQESLQIRRVDDTKERPTSDITIYDNEPSRLREAAVAYAGDTHQMVLTLPDVMSDDNDLSEATYKAIALYEVETRRQGGQPIAWLEILSRSNKPGGRDAQTYRTKRRVLLDRGLVLIEIDYLHESSPTLSQIPNYRTRGRKQQAEPGSHPYRILVLDPRPRFDKGKVYTYQFDVDELLPLVTIPLRGEDKLTVDFGAPYHKTLAEALFAYEWVDYRQFPMNFDRYSAADQARVATRMLAVLEAERAGIDLETGPFPIKEMTLEAALAQLETLKQQET